MGGYDVFPHIKCGDWGVFSHHWGIGVYRESSVDLRDPQWKISDGGIYICPLKLYVL